MGERSQIENCRGIVCIGDSLTAGFGGGGSSYPKVLESCLRTGGDSLTEVVNLGVNGEDSITILGRTGALPFCLSESLILRQDGYPAELKLHSPITPEICPLVYGNAGLERVRLSAEDGRVAEGSLSREGGYFFGERLCFRLERVRAAMERREKTDGRVESGRTAALPASSEGSDAEAPLYFPAGTQLIPRAAWAYRDYIPVILMGANGQYETLEELLLQHETLRRFYRDPAGRHLILGLHLGSAAEMREAEEQFQERFGAHFVNLRAYMSTQGLADAGMEPTEADCADMQKGRTPESLLYDGLHFNSRGYELLGKLVYQRLQELPER